MDNKEVIKCSTLKYIGFGILYRIFHQENPYLFSN